MCLSLVGREKKGKARSISQELANYGPRAICGPLLFGFPNLKKCKKSKEERPFNRKILGFNGPHVVHGS